MTAGLLCRRAAPHPPAGPFSPQAGRRGWSNGSFISDYWQAGEAYLQAVIERGSRRGISLLPACGEKVAAAG
nr:hypothetical protein SHINE37_42240 [Rhizobiaceae bacterium]